jgi:plastocyanin
MTVQSRGIAVAISAGLLAVAAMVSSPGRPQPAHADWTGINIVEPGFIPDSWGYDPPVQTVHLGDLVTWTNLGNAPHTATADGGAFDSPILFAGESWTFVADSAGEYAYFCKVHPAMRATLVVVP